MCRISTSQIRNAGERNGDEKGVYVMFLCSTPALNISSLDGERRPLHSWCPKPQVGADHAIGKAKKTEYGEQITLL